METKINKEKLLKRLIEYTINSSSIKEEEIKAILEEAKEKEKEKPQYYKREKEDNKDDDTLDYIFSDLESQEEETDLVDPSEKSNLKKKKMNILKERKKAKNNLKKKKITIEENTDIIKFYKKYEDKIFDFSEKISKKKELKLNEELQKVFNEQYDITTKIIVKKFLENNNCKDINDLDIKQKKELLHKIKNPNTY